MCFSRTYWAREFQGCSDCWSILLRAKWKHDAHEKFNFETWYPKKTVHAMWKLTDIGEKKVHNTMTRFSMSGLANFMHQQTTFGRKATFITVNTRAYTNNLQRAFRWNNIWSTRTLHRQGVSPHLFNSFSYVSYFQWLCIQFSLCKSLFSFLVDKCISLVAHLCCRFSSRAWSRADYYAINALLNWAAQKRYYIGCK